MQEVTVLLRFTRPCLGYAKRLGRSGDVVYRMPRATDGAVTFLPSWWRDGLDYAARVSSRQSGLVGKIAWDPVIDGKLKSWRRIVVRAADDRRRRSRYAVHEGFHPGDTIGVSAVLPDGLSAGDFHELLRVMGAYKGISPFQNDRETYGTFEVVSVTPVVHNLGPVSEAASQP